MQLKYLIQNLPDAVVERPDRARDHRPGVRLAQGEAGDAFCRAARAKRWTGTRSSSRPSRRGRWRCSARMSTPDARVTAVSDAGRASGAGGDGGGVLPASRATAENAGRHGDEREDDDDISDQAHLREGAAALRPAGHGALRDWRPHPARVAHDAGEPGRAGDAFANA